MALFNQRRKHSKIDLLPEPVKDTVDSMLDSPQITYEEISDYLRSQEHDISIASICRYAKTRNATIVSLKAANENLKVFMDEVAKYPSLDTTEGLLRLLSHQMFETIQKIPEGKWNDIDPVDLLRQVTSLSRAAAYKQKTDIATMGAMNAGYEQVKTLVFEAMAKEKPELYEQVSKFLEDKKSEPPA